MKKYCILVPTRAMQCMLGFVICRQCICAALLDVKRFSLSLLQVDQETSIQPVARVCVHSTKHESKQMRILWLVQLVLCIMIQSKVCSKQIISTYTL